MCWSGRRIYDQPYGDCLREIDAAIARLKQAGAAAFVVAGHSLGANGALGYGAMNSGLRGIVALAPGHRPEVLSKHPAVAKSLALARKLVAAGRGDIPDKFIDVNGNLTVTVKATPNAYLSFLAPNSALADARQCRAAKRAAALRGGNGRSPAKTRSQRDLRQGATAIRSIAT